MASSITGSIRVPVVATRFSQVSCVRMAEETNAYVGTSPSSANHWPAPWTSRTPRSVSRRRWSSGANDSALPWRMMTSRRRRAGAEPEDESGEGGLTSVNLPPLRLPVMPMGAHGPTRSGIGDLLVIGGAEDKLGKRTVLAEFVKRAGGSDARIAVVPTASSLGPEI